MKKDGIHLSDYPRVFVPSVEMIFCEFHIHLSNLGALAAESEFVEKDNDFGLNLKHCAN